MYSYTVIFLPTTKAIFFFHYTQCVRSMYVCMHVCMVITYGKGIIDQPGKVANPARGQLDRENDVYPVPVRA